MTTGRLQIPSHLRSQPYAALCDHVDPKSSILSRIFCALDPEDAEVFFVKVYCGIGEALRRLSIQVKVLLDITVSMKKIPSHVPTLAKVQEAWAIQQSVRPVFRWNAIYKTR